MARVIHCVVAMRRLALTAALGLVAAAGVLAESRRAEASGPRVGGGAPVARAHAFAPRAEGGRAFRRGPAAFERRAGAGLRDGRFRRDRFGYGLGPFYDGFAGYDDRRTTLLERQEEPVPRRVDPFSHEAIPVLIGIRPPPRGEAVVYRLEGRGAKPSVRILHLGLDGRATGVTGDMRLTRDDSGPRIITVPPR